MSTPLVDTMNKLTELDKEHGRAMPQPHRLILICIASHVGKNAYAWPSMPTLARFACTDERHARRYARELENHGWIRCSRRSHRGESASSAYQLTLDTARPFSLTPPTKVGAVEPGGRGARGPLSPQVGAAEPPGGGCGARGVGAVAPPEQFMEQSIEQINEQIIPPIPPVDGGRPGSDLTVDPVGHVAEAGGVRDEAPPTSPSPSMPPRESLPEASNSGTGSIGQAPVANRNAQQAPQEPDCGPLSVRAGQGGQLTLGGVYGQPAAEQPPSRSRHGKRAGKPKAPKPSKEQSAGDRYAHAYAQGQTDASGHPFAVPTNKSVFWPVLKAYAVDERGQEITGDALIAWLRASSAAYRRAKMADPRYERGFCPTKWREWLQAGKPGPIAYGKPFLKQAGNGMPEATHELTPEQEAAIGDHPF